MYSLSLLVCLAALCLFLMLYGLLTRTTPLTLAGLALLVVTALIYIAMRYPPMVGFAV